MTRLRTLLACVGALLAAFAAVLVAPASLAQAQGQPGQGTLTVRGIDGTTKDQIGVTFLWTGEPKALEQLTIREDGGEKKVDSLVDLRKTEKRLGTVVLVDLSGSMGDDGALSRAKAGISELVKNLPDGDQMAIVSYTNDVVVESAFTDDAAQLNGALAAMAAPRDGKTAMYNGLRKAADLFASRPSLQANMILVADGANDVAGADLAQARSAVAASGSALYLIDFTHDKKTDVASVQSIIDRTGGSVFSGSSASEVAKAFTAADRAMRSQYVATYASTAEQGSVNVTVAVGGVETQASYVVGDTAKGAATNQAITSNKAFGPDWLRGDFGKVLAFVLVGLAIGLGAYAIALLVTRNETGLTAMLRPYDEGGMVKTEDDEDSGLAQTALLQRAVEITEDFAERQGTLAKVEKLLERADLPLRAAEALFFYLAGVAVLGLLALVLAGPVAGLALMIIVGLFPPAGLNLMATLRGKKFVRQLPDTLSLLSGSLRAGYSLLQGVEAVSQEVTEPMGKELRRVITEARLGRDVEDAMEAVAVRMDSPDFAWAVMAVRIQREVGGNLSELLLTVADTMVHRDRLRRDVAALTAEGKISAIILGLLPVGLGGFMWLSNPEYMAPLSETGLGQGLLGAAFVSAGIGFLWMKKTINIEI